MPGGRKGERGVYFFIMHCHRLTFTDWRVRQRGAGGSYSKRRHFEYVCQRVGRGHARNVSFGAFGRSILPDPGAGGGSFGDTLLSEATLTVGKSVGKQGENAT